MDAVFGSDLSAFLGDLERRFNGAIAAFLDPWVPAQLIVILIAVSLGYASGRRIERALEPNVRAVQGQRRLLRLLALLLRRVRWIVATLCLLAAIVIIRAVTLPERSAIVATAALMIAAWIVISVLSRLIRNRTLARLVGWGAWIVVALRITGFHDDAARTLDTLAMHVGAVRISLYDIIQAAVVVTLALWLATLAGHLIERRVAGNADLTPSLKVLLGKLARIVLVVLAGGVALAALGIDLTALTVFSGAVGVGVGFGLQKVVSNFVSGIIILLDKSIKPGDTIALGETFGFISSLRARFVSVVTRDGRSYLIPNEDFITERVVNWSYTDTLLRFDVHFGTSYDSDPHEVRRVAVEAAKTVERVRGDPSPVCHMTKFNDFSLDFVLRFWITDPRNGVTNVRGAVMLALWDAFRAAGIAFPYPRREVAFATPLDIRMRHEPGSDDPAPRVG